jgi:hypothetical protein
VLAQSPNWGTYAAINSGNNPSPVPGSGSPYPAAQVSSGLTLDDIVVTAEGVSTAAGWTGIGADAGDLLSGEASLGTNFRVYSAPRGNQYFRTLAKFSTAFKITGAGALVAGTAADYYDAFNTDSYFQANLNLGIGLGAVFLPPLALPGAFYFIGTQYYGSAPAYNAAYSNAMNAAEGGGP